jgi:hypothetical protein
MGAVLNCGPQPTTSKQISYRANVETSWTKWRCVAVCTCLKTWFGGEGDTYPHQSAPGIQFAHSKGRLSTRSKNLGNGPTIKMSHESAHPRPHIVIRGSTIDIAYLVVRRITEVAIVVAIMGACERKRREKFTKNVHQPYHGPERKGNVRSTLRTVKTFKIRPKINNNNKIVSASRLSVIMLMLMLIDLIDSVSAFEHSLQHGTRWAR